MSYLTYKLIHLAGVFLLMVALAGMAGHAESGQQKGNLRVYRWLQWIHGFGALAALVGGFGLLARIGTSHGELFPGWVWSKLFLWVLMGGLIALPYRSRAGARVLFLVLPLLGILGGYLANAKPF